ncbi:MAG: DUF3619 family protein [Burkholderiales bacterium]
MTEDDRDEGFIRAIRSRLDQSTEHLDAATLSRLAQARHAALEGPGRARTRRYWLPAAALATAASAVVVAVLVSRAPATSEPMLEDLELIAAPDELDLYGDLEFYAWLEEYESAS